MAVKKKYGADAVNAFAARLQSARIQEEQAMMPEHEKQQPLHELRIDENQAAAAPSSSPEPFEGAAQTTGAAKDAGAPETIVPDRKPETKPPHEPANRGLVTPPLKRETRSGSLMIRIRPSLKARVQALCEKEGISIGEAINQLFEQWLDESE